MRGVGEAHAAVTVLNALATGIGGAVGIGLAARAEATLSPARDAPPRLTVDPGTSRTPVVRHAVRIVYRKFLASTPMDVHLRITSEIPPSRGLKSSSAVGSAVVLAVARASGAAPSPMETARLSASAARASGTSATGAFDDALAGLEAGVVITDNRADELLRRIPMERGLEAALWIPPGDHPPSPHLAERFRPLEERARSAVDTAMNGDWRTAMELNSEVVEAAMGYAYRDLRRSLKEAGAVASGTSGMGPAVAAVAPRSKIRAVMARFPQTSGIRRAVPFPEAGPYLEGAPG